MIVRQLSFFSSIKLVSAVSLFGALVAACQAVSNPALEQAHNAYQQARQDPLIVRNASATLERAARTLEAADRLWTEKHDVAEVEHLAYVAEQRVKIAKAVAERRVAEDEIQPPSGHPQ